MNKMNKLLLSLSLIAILFFCLSCDDTPVSKLPPLPKPKKPEWDPLHFKIIEGKVLDATEGVEVNGHFYTVIVYQTDEPLSCLNSSSKEKIYIEGMPSGQTFYLNQKNRIIYCYKERTDKVLASPNPKDMMANSLGIKKVELIKDKPDKPK